jgi:hypothetical protein
MAASSMVILNSSDTEIDGRLNPGEKLLWSGQPRQGLRLRRLDLPSILFSLLFLGLCSFWEFGVFAVKAPIIFKFVGALLRSAGPGKNVS